jgi:hypothetical protein
MSSCQVPKTKTRKLELKIDNHLDQIPSQVNDTYKAWWVRSAISGAE